MELAVIQEAQQRRLVAEELAAGFSASEIANDNDLPLSTVARHIEWLATKRVERLQEDREVSDIVADEILSIEDDEARVRRLMADEDLTVNNYLKLFDRLHKLRELRLKLLGGFTVTGKSSGPQQVLLVHFDGSTEKINEVIVEDPIELPAIAVTENNQGTNGSG